MEVNYYSFGLELGARNLFHNGFALGLRKSFGKLLQPINSYTRIPEYEFMGSWIEAYAKRGRVKILDVGSPKCFGLGLAHRLNAEVHMTDIDQASVEEALILCAAMREKSSGKAEFSVADGRKLDYPDESFDIVYAMSV